MAKIPLTQGQTALVDDKDLERLSQHKWYARRDRNTFYAGRHTPRNPETGKRHMILMHREVIGAQLGEEVDHVNGDGTDNRRANLRICNKAQNQMNRQKQCETSSKFKGVYWDKECTKWRALIGHNGRYIHIGYSLDEADAARAYDDRARVLFGQYARLNFPRKGEQSALSRGEGA